MRARAGAGAGRSLYGERAHPERGGELPPGLPFLAGKTRLISGSGRRLAYELAMFDRMLEDLNVVITPGSGFGSEGEGYFRISAFNSRENAEEVGRRMEAASFSDPAASIFSPGSGKIAQGRDKAGMPCARQERPTTYRLGKERSPEILAESAAALPVLFSHDRRPGQGSGGFSKHLREAALLASRGQLPPDRLWVFHEARHQCLDAGEGRYPTGERR